MSDFHLTNKQQQAADILASQAMHIMLAGGSRSGKTFILILAMITRALRAPGSKQTVLRFRFNHVKQSIIYGTLPQVLRLCFPQVKAEMNKSDWFLQLPGGSEIWFGGLDDKERTEKILGNEFCGIFLNECSQIPYSSRNIAMTRLAQKINDQTGKLLPLRMYYDENPPDKGHWTYKLFKAKQDPDSKGMLQDPDNYAYLQMNPKDNEENLSPEFIHTLESLPGRMRKRFLEGEFRELAPNALFTDEILDKWRALDDLPEILRIVVAVDPSGADDEDNAENDAIGICVAGLGMDGNAYILEDLTCKTGPRGWGKVATDAFDRHGADRIVGEDNYGGAMVKANIQACRPRTPYRNVHASRGKWVRAEPIATLMESGKVRLAGYFRELEDELCAFTTHGYTGDGSPNRADACLIAGTMIVTDRGDVPIEQVTTNDRVLTRMGMKRVIWSGETKKAASTLSLTLSSGACIIGTYEHPVWIVGKGFVPLGSIQMGSMLMPTAEVFTCSQLKSNSTDGNIAVIQTILTRRASAIIALLPVKAMVYCIAIFGNIILGLSRKVAIFITEMGIGLTTIFRTWNALLQQNIQTGTPLMNACYETGNSLPMQSQPPQHGMQAKLALNGIARQPNVYGNHASERSSENVRAAANSLNPSNPVVQSAIAPRNAIGRLLTNNIATWCKSIARSAAPCFGKRNGAENRRPVVEHVESNIGKCAVYNLHVEDCHEFVANGVLVHNCIWAISDLFPELTKPEKEPVAASIPQPISRLSRNSWMHNL